MSQQGYVAAPPYSQAQARLGGYQAGPGGAPPQPLNGLYGGPPQVFSAPPAGRNLPRWPARTRSGGKPGICHFRSIF